MDTKIKLKELTFDERKYSTAKDKVDEARETINTLIKELLEEDMPVTLAFIREITAEELSFDTYIKKIYKDRINTGYYPRAEKEMVLKIYNELYWNLNPFVQKVRQLIDQGYLLTEKKGVCALNEAKAEEKAREDATTRYDTGAMQAYWDVIADFMIAQKKLADYEEKNGLPPSTTIQFCPTPEGTIAMPPLIQTFGQNPTPERFQEMFATRFTIKK